MLQVTAKDALLVVDVQNDFCSGGALAVPEGERVVRVINCMQKAFDHIVFSRDWHPDEHCSFSYSPEYKDGSWPTHCVQDTPGAEFHGDLRIPVDALIVDKAVTPEKDAYSAFEGTGLAAKLRGRRVERVFVTGLALDYCVRATALDALKEGFSVLLVQDAVRAVNPANTTEVLKNLEEAGVTIIKSECLT
ncbi:MAG: nicotinamidase [Candidatus Hydrogenedentes bacterium]|nr:nicotinamidase [Candidatus Hydrogenedentota bacterium]